MDKKEERKIAAASFHRVISRLKWLECLQAEAAFQKEKDLLEGCKMENFTRENGIKLKSATVVQALDQRAVRMWS